MTALLFLLLAQSPMDVGMKALDANQWAEAEQAFEKAVTAEPGDYAAHFHLALVRTFLNKDEAAMAGFRKTLELKPGLYEAQINLGLLYHRYRKFPEAIEQLKAAAAQKPNDVRTLFHLADAYRETKQYAAAEPVFRQLLTLDQKLEAVHQGLAQSLAATGKLEEAVPHFEKSNSWLELAQAYEDAGQWEKAIPIYERVTPDLAILTRLAGAYLRQKQFDKAEGVVTQALKLAPNDYDLRLTYGRLLRDKRQFQSAATQFAAAVNLKPQEPAALNELAGMLISLEDYDRALLALDRLKALNAEIPGHLFFRAVIHDKRRQADHRLSPKPAIDAYRAFLAVADGKYPDEEFKARQRARILEKEAARR